MTSQTAVGRSVGGQKVLIAWSVGDRSVGRLVGWSIGRSVGLSVGSTVVRSVGHWFLGSRVGLSLSVCV